MIRRWIARKQLAHNTDRWPIDPKAARPPANWPGWPDDKKFALVLTHDVEGPEGLEKCRALAAIEQEMGFRSSFNFIPEGPYRVPPALRQWLTENGFEVGVHDLHHDGKLFSSDREFREKASRINRYIREWHASGFRAGFMLRNLDWYHHLDIAYDASTFDTDPFEPQSDGTSTIFPFWVPLPEAPESGRGYIELPYSLPQDSTLFLILQHQAPSVWIEKLDWIAQKGGMALLNVHPDYVRFANEPVAPHTFPLEHYRTLLRHARERHGAELWHRLPREVAAFAASVKPRLSHRRPKHVGMVTHSFYETDNRVTRYAETLAERGDTVEVFALQKDASVPREETVNGVRIVRLQGREESTRNSAIAYFLHLLRFLAVTGCRVALNHQRRPYDLLHIHNMPDFLVFSAFYPKLRGARVILDIHDIVPELYSTKFGTGKPGMSINMLKSIERQSAAFADHIIISNHLWLETFSTRTNTVHKCSVFINNVDTRTFHPGLRTRRDDDRILILFPGSLQWHQGLDLAIEAFASVSRAVPQAELHIYGEGNMKPALQALAAKLELKGKVQFFPPVPIHKIALIMANADVGVVPKRADSFGNEAYSTKIMEFMAVGVPVVVSATKIDRYYFTDSVVKFFPSGHSDALGACLTELLHNKGQREILRSNALEYCATHSWATRRAEYLRLVDTLIDGTRDPHLPIPPHLEPIARNQLHEDRD